LALSVAGDPWTMRCGFFAAGFASGLYMPRCDHNLIDRNIEAAVAVRVGAEPGVLARRSCGIISHVADLPLGQSSAAAALWGWRFIVPAAAATSPASRLLRARLAY
jgi:hypothetical protein